MSVLRKQDDERYLVHRWAEPYLLVVSNIMTSRMGSFSPLERAAEIIDALLERGWTPPGGEHQ